MSEHASTAHKPDRLDFRNLALFLALLTLWIFFAVASKGSFIDPGNLRNIAIDLSMLAILALGMLLVMVVGHIDLAVGSGVGLTAAMVAVFISGAPLPDCLSYIGINGNFPILAPILAMGLSLVVIVALWIGMGWFIARERIPAFIMTLAGMLVFKGAYLLIIKSSTVSVRMGDANLLSGMTSASLSHLASWVLTAVVMGFLCWGVWKSRNSRKSMGLPVADAETAVLGLLCTGQVLAVILLNIHIYTPTEQGIPFALLLLAAVATGTWVLTQHTRLGRHIYACGSNEAAAALSGVPVRRVTTWAFALCGLAVVLAGWLQAAFTASATTTTGINLELDAIAACVIGGVSVKGGRGTVVGVLCGALLIGTLLNGLATMGVGTEAKFIARGAILALAVWMDVRLNQRR